MKKKLGSVVRVVQKSGPVQIAPKYKKNELSFAVKPEERLKCWYLQQALYGYTEY
jgi:hypothetical protein